MARKILINPETTVTWRDSGGDNTITLATLGSGTGRNGEIRDWGAAPRASRYHVKFFCEFNTVPVVGQVVRVFIREAGLGDSATFPTNDDGTGDVALSAEDKLRNLLHVATLVVDEASATAVMAVEAIFETASRHFGPVIFNDTDDALSSTAAENGVDITPIPDEVQ